ncbi:tRNA lysidine(34) synthetase TilS [Candidatus Phytoplasma sacchari]|uniref:tRNA(Ile)-lysidine synthase n=1 Tax=Candidatus Phytoplasma sacchari TaxID=2609813 RepID=A0ABY7M1R2_9MOLU|nr:tRNA lysidine(34) synthetase TilS [Candidatus Phytoplasma sacchari]
MILSVNLDKTQNYIISVSGGVDSMVLLDFLYKKKYNLKVVHFNHSIRKDSFKDKILIENYCKEKNIVFYYFKLNLNIKEKNFQNKARILRLEKLKKVASEYKTKYIITAHHLDDLSENVFLKILRGSSLSGYGGMKTSCNYDNFILLKPFLYIEKNKIIEYAKKNKIIFLEDYTNQQNIYLRNQIRNIIIPFFKKSRNFLKNIIKFHSQINEVSNFIRKKTIIFLKYQNNFNIFNLKSFLNLDITIQKDVILFLFENRKISKNFFLINNIIHGLNNEKKPFIIWKLNFDYSLIKKYKEFTIEHNNFLNLMNTEYKEPFLHFSENKSDISFCNIIEKIYYNSNNFFPPLIIRKKKPKDVLKFNFGTQKLKNFFINKKIILFQRKLISIITDQKNNIIWIPNLYVNKTLGKTNFLYLGINYKNNKIS